MNRAKLPTIIGMNPPTKELIIFPNIREKCIDMFVCHAEFPKGTKKGKYDSECFDELRGMCDWIRFVDAESMEMFGKDIIRMARKYKELLNK